MLKKRVSTAALALLMMTSTNAYGASAPQFSDFPSDWSTKSLTWAVENGLLSGTNDGKIAPKGVVTRAQMAAITSRAFGAENTTSLEQFSDVDSNAWYYDGLSKAVRMGAMAGSDGKLNPDSPISRQEAFSVLARIFSLDTDNQTTLNQFQDNDKVATWAKEATAALVEKNYVKGDGESLNPTSSITRAEMMQIMSKMIGTYDTPNDNHVTGNMVIRDDKVDLKGTTIDGDLILADGAKNVNLDGVTVTGSILVRGGSEGINIKDTKVNEITIAEKSNVTVHNGTIQKVNVTQRAENANLHIAKDATVNNVIASANDVKIEGVGKVDNVQVNANQVDVSTPNTKVDVSENATGVIVGGSEVKGGQTVNTNTSGNVSSDTKTDSNTSGGGNGGSGGGSSSGGGSGSGGGSVSPDKPVTNKLVKEAKMVDLGWSRYMIISFANGQSVKNCTLTVDGVDITSAVTPVTDDGSVVKWEAVNLSPSKLVVANNTRNQTITFENGINVAPAVKQNTAPDYFLLNGPVQVWDYHLTNYDEHGNVRRNPSKTTFDLSEKKNDIPSYSPDAELIPDENAENAHKVSGTVEVMFNYANGTEAEKAFVDGITDVDLVAYNSNKNTLNDNLKYTIDKKFAHGDHTVACIKIPLGQSNFFTNGRYNIRVTSNGTARLFPIHVVNQKAPSMQLAQDTVVCGQNVHFNVSDMVYGITMPVYRVDLKDPNGNIQTLKKIDDYYLLGDLFVLYNEPSNHTTIPGNYEITVYADGFHKFSKVFHVKSASSADYVDDEGEDAYAEYNLPFDAITSASVGGGGSDGGSGGGSTVMNANLIIDTDLLVNAKILKNLGAENADIDGIIERWDTMKKLYVFNEGAETVYTADGYFDAVNVATTKGEYLTFSDYIKGGNAQTTQNRPYTVKQVLEDNLLGETTSFDESSAKAAPDFIEKSQEGKDITFTCENTEYLDKLVAEGELLLNNDHSILDKANYEVKNNTLTIKNIYEGENTLIIRVPGYQTLKLSFMLDKNLENVDLTTETKLTEKKDIVITCNSTTHEENICDFFANITQISMTAPNGNTRPIHPEGQEADGLGYTVNGNTLTIGKKIFDEAFAQGENGNYTINISAKYYGDKTLTVNLQLGDAVIPGPDETLKAPAVKGMTLKDADIITPKHYHVELTGGQLSEYLTKIDRVTINGNTITKSHILLPTDTKTCKISSSIDLGIDFTEDCFQGVESFDVVVVAKGYENLQFTVKDGKIEDQTGGHDTAKPTPNVNKIEVQAAGWFTPEHYRVEFNEDSDLSTYLDVLNTHGKITIDDKPMKRVPTDFAHYDSNSYRVLTSNVLGIAFTKDCFPEDNTVTVKVSVEGYEDLTFTVTNGALATESSSLQEVPEVDAEKDVVEETPMVAPETSAQTTPSEPQSEVVVPEESAQNSIPDTTTTEPVEDTEEQTSDAATEPVESTTDSVPVVTDEQTEI